MIPPTLTASVTSSPAASSASVRLTDSRSQPASAPVRISAQPAVMAISQPK